MAKIVRDNVVRNIRESGENVKSAVLKDADAVRGLASKMLEELEELILAETHNERLNELSDVLEIVRGIARQYKIDWVDLIDCADKKRQRNGGFDALRILIDDQSGDPSIAIDADIELSLGEIAKIGTVEDKVLIPFSILMGTIGRESAGVSWKEIAANLQFRVKAGAVIISCDKSVY